MSIKSLEKDLQNRPFRTFLKIGSGIVLAFFILGGLMYALSYFGEAGAVIKEELGPRALLKKYEWFKDTSASLDAKGADIQIYHSKIVRMEKDYEGATRKDWDRTDKESLNIWYQELAGIKSSYNSLAAQYNAQMAKIHWRFCNAGDLPEGATQVLPREFREYVIK